LGFSAKLYPKVFGLAATPDLKIIFIITLNLHDPNLSESGYNTGLIITLNKNIGCGSDYKVVS